MVLLLKPYLTPARTAAGPGRLPRRLLPAPAGRRPASCLVAGRWRGSAGRTAARVGAVLGRLAEQLTPRVLAVVHVSRRAGAALLGRHARPPPGGSRCSIAWCRSGVIEASHFLGSLAGAALLILSQGLARRLDAAYYLTAIAIVVGHGGLAAEGVRLRRGGPAAPRAAGPAAGAAGLRSARRVLRHAVLAGMDRGAGRGAGRLGVAGPVRVQARGLLATALVAVRAPGRSVAIPARLGRRRDRAAAVRAGPADRSRAARGRRPPTDADLEMRRARSPPRARPSPYLVYLRDKALLFNDGAPRS